MAIILFRLLALFIVPAIAFPVQPERLALCSDAAVARSPQTLPSYDDILMLIEAIENDEWLDTEQLEKTAWLLSVLAWNGVRPGDSWALELDIYEVLCATRSGSHPENRFSSHAVLCRSADALLCKSWVHKQCHSLKKFVSKHKTAIIIGAAVVVAVTVAVIAIALAAGTTAASTAATAAGAAASGAAARSEEEQAAVQGSPASILPADPIQAIEQAAPLLEIPLLVAIVEDEAALVKEALFETIPAESSVASSHALGDRARELGSRLAHDILDGVAEMAVDVPHLLAQVAEIGSMVLPEGLYCQCSEEDPFDPVGNYEAKIAGLHEKIDVLFSTSLAQRYTPEAKANAPENVCSIGVLPPPGMAILGSAFDFERLAEAGKAIDRREYTRAGRSLTKHSYRPNSVFPKPRGNPEQVNAQGQRILEEILSSPNKEFVEASKEGIKIYSPDGRGAHFREDGSFVGFVEKQHEKKLHP